MKTTATLPILRAENVQLIADSAPDTYNSNALSAQRCSDFGQALLAETQKGMTDELDQRCAEYINKSRKTLKVMNERRAPITKLFDQIRGEFTAMENSVDVTKKDSIPGQIQAARNAYAALKREEAERIRQEELKKQQREIARQRYRQELEDSYRSQFQTIINFGIGELTRLDQLLTLANYDETSKLIKECNTSFQSIWLKEVIFKPYELTEEEAQVIRAEVMDDLMNQFAEQYAFDIEEYRDSLLDLLPSKRAELERIAKADAEEQARLKAELDAKLAEEHRRIEQERAQRAEEAKTTQALERSATELGGLFDQQSVADVAYQPKASVKWRITATDANGILAILSLWWSKEGQYLPVDELSKMFKKQITFCEKLANDKANPEQIENNSVIYTEEVKAK